SVASFQAIDTRTILFGLAGIKNVGMAAVEELLRARRLGPFRSLFDIARRTDSRIVNRRALEALIAAGAFDSLGQGHRAQLMAAVEKAVEYARITADAGPMQSLFDASGIGPTEPELPDVPPWSFSEQLRREREVLGLYLSAHPLQEYESLLQGVVVPLARLQQWVEQANGNAVRVAAVVTAVQRRRDRQQRPIAFATVEDWSGQAEAVFWHEAFVSVELYLREGELLLLSGRVELRESSPRLIVATAEPLERGLRRLARGFRLELPVSDHTLEVIQRLHRLQQSSPSGCPVLLCLYEQDTPISAYLIPHLGVELSAQGYRDLMEVLREGRGRVGLWME
ncbi:MAG: OB-fold nucleic acid binding domain-containing protein, partial [Candidatus Kapabacteria bacterium]|nr:OB-fold nucleic acid binding domain-containing protein [Candidatus Kapabacteria bacterium]MDW8225649.1 OB-fold nucleic acid binding domain-containing protein [Bacteroidota bacterium]